MTNTGKPNYLSLRVMLAEYQQAQASAEHYNSLLWQVINIFTAANAVLLAAIGTAVVAGAAHRLQWLFLLAVAALGLVMNMAALRFTHVFRSYQNQKLERCRELERTIETLSLTQMTNHKGLCSLKGIHRFWYFTLEGVLLGIWITLLVVSIRAV